MVSCLLLSCESFSCCESLNSIVCASMLDKFNYLLVLCIELLDKFDYFCALLLVELGPVSAKTNRGRLPTKVSF